MNPYDDMTDDHPSPGTLRLLNDISRANARLIAAAPELLAALERLASIADDGAVMRHETGKPQWSFIDEVKQSARAAIARAIA